MSAERQTPEPGEGPVSELERLRLENARLRDELQHVHTLHEVVLEFMDDGVFTVDLEQRITTFNRAAERITGYSRRDVLGRQVVEVLGELDEDLTWQQVLSHERPPRPVERRVSLPARVPKVLRFQPSLPEQTQPGAALVVVFRDISKVYELEQLRADFTATLSHELRTPLTSIKGYLQTLMHRKARDFDHEKRQSYLAIISHQADRLNRLIQDLLEAARLSSQALEVNPRPTHLRELLEVTIEEHGHDKNPITLECENSVVAHCDPDQIRYVMNHLLSNAVKYSLPGGEVQVRCNCETSRNLSIAIQDEGVGIPLDQQEKIFEMYHRVDTGTTRTHYGVGMGLYLARKIIDAHGGAIQVVSAPGCGSTFTFTLPLIDPDS